MDLLPIDPFLPSIISTMRDAGTLVLTAPPGAGKTTRIPRALYQAGFADEGDILVLEPRRLAARLAASRVAQELGEKPGETVGYSIRFETVAGPRTRIRFLTEAILARRMIHDPFLQGVSVVVLDEYHERHLSTDLALSFTRRLQESNPALKLIVMSATLDAEPVASFLNAPLMRLPGSPYETTIEYIEKSSEKPLQEQVASAVARLWRKGIQGDVLVFLPGSSEIRRSAEALQPFSERLGFSIAPLHGDIPSSEQSRAIAYSEKRKIILATNVAETSITIPGIAAVIDSGLARVAGHSPWSGLPTLTTAKISRSSAVQRAGRAGRTQAGHVLRLYTKWDFEARPEHEIPEIRRADLADTALMLHGAGICNLQDFPWFEAPSRSALEAAEELLLRLGAVDNAGQITVAGRRMLELPVHPRLARLIIDGQKLGVAEESTLLAALLSERDIRLEARASFASANTGPRTGSSGPSDLLELLDRYQEAERVGFSAERVLALGLDPGAIQSVRRAQQHLLRSAKEGAGRSSPDAREENLLIAILAAFPDRVVKRRKPGSRELVLAAGGAAVLSPASVVHESVFAVAVDAEERKDRGLRETAAVVRLASGIEIEWLAALFPDAVEEKIELLWNERAGRVDEARRTYYGQLILEERTSTAQPSEEAARLIASKVLSDLASDPSNLEVIAAFQQRVALAAEYFPAEQYPAGGEREIRECVESLCGGIVSLQEFHKADLLNALIGSLNSRQQSMLRREVPEKITLKAGRIVKIHYEAGRPPWIQSRLQDFFGMTATPSICAGRLPLTIHLLAPNQRAVQVTSDLAGFWKNHYPSIRKELQRRYPKHAWPEEVAG